MCWPRCWAFPASEFERKITRDGQIEPGATGRRTGLPAAARSGVSSKVRREHLYEAGKRVRLKPNIDALYGFLSEEVEGFQFDFYVISAGPVEMIRSALGGHHSGRPHLRHRVRVQRRGRDRAHHAGDGRLRQGCGHRSAAGKLKHRPRPHRVRRRRQLRHSRDAARQPSRRLHHRRVGEQDTWRRSPSARS